VVVKQVLEENPQAVEDIKGWQQKAIWFLIGQVMKKTQGKADPKMVRQIIMKLIG
jgi:aspartyl-tRNA(Asn)/glutamyl-tRNA(Gln) amidotransferase subunit B